MQLFKKLENGVPTGNSVGADNFKRMFRTELRASGLTPEKVAELGYCYFDAVTAPGNTDATKEYVIGDVVESNGVWANTYTLVDKELSEEELATVIEQKMSEIRFTREYLLWRTDFYALADAPTMSAEMTTYRQALRDLPSNVTDVFNVTYPVNPEDPEGLLA